MRHSVKARVAQCSGSELSQALTHTHTHSLQCEDCFMEDTIPGVMNESGPSGKRRSNSNSSCQDGKQFTRT